LGDIEDWNWHGGRVSISCGRAKAELLSRTGIKADSLSCFSGCSKNALVMEKSEGSTPNASTKLAIHEEVERQCEKRIKLQEWFYGRLIVLFIVLVGAFGVVLWKVQLSEVRKTVLNQLAEQEVIKAKDRIIAIKSEAEDANRNLNSVSISASNSLASISTQQQEFTNRLNQIKQQDNVVLVGDIQKLFIVETVTNLVDGNKIILKYEPIPQTVRIKVPTRSGSRAVSSLTPRFQPGSPPLTQFLTLDGTAYTVDGNTITLVTNVDNGPDKLLHMRLWAITNLVSWGITDYVIRPDLNWRSAETEISGGKTNHVVYLGIASVEYVRKSLR